jgi:hypothetical protein
MTQVVKMVDRIKRVDRLANALYNIHKLLPECPDPTWNMKVAKMMVRGMISNKTQLRSSAETESTKEFYRNAARDILSRTYPEYTDKDVVQKSYSKGPDASFGKGPYNITLPDPSKYMSYSDCVSDLTDNLHVDSSIAAEHCKSVNADAGQSGPSKQNNVDSGDSYVGRKAKTLIPPKGTITPAWASSILDAEAIKPTAPIAPMNVKSAGLNFQQNKELYGTSIADILRDTKERRNQIRENRLKQAAKEDTRPSWVKALNLE